MRSAGLIALAAAGILCLPATIYVLIDATSAGMSGLTVGIWGLIGAVGAAGLGLLIIRAVSAGKYDPNEAPVEMRKQLGNELAVSKEEYLKIVGAS